MCVGGCKVYADCAILVRELPMLTACMNASVSDIGMRVAHVDCMHERQYV